MLLEFHKNKAIDEQQCAATTYDEIDFRNITSDEEMFKILDEKVLKDEVSNLLYGIIEEVSNPTDTKKDEEMTFDELGRKHYKTPHSGF